MNLEFTYKNKKIIVILVLVLLVVLGHKKIIRNTYNQIQNYYKQKSSILNENELERKIIEVNTKIVEMDKMLGKVNFNENFIQHEILDYVSLKAGEKNIEVVELNPAHLYQEDRCLIVSNSITLKGEYNKLIALIYQIEQELKSSKISSVHFFKKKNFLSNKSELFVRLIFQNYKKV